jgi:hypothetical protein
LVHGSIACACSPLSVGTHGHDLRFVVLSRMTGRSYGSINAPCIVRERFFCCCCWLRRPDDLAGLPVSVALVVRLLLYLLSFWARGPTVRGPTVHEQVQQQGSERVRDRHGRGPNDPCLETSLSVGAYEDVRMVGGPPAQTVRGPTNSCTDEPVELVVAVPAPILKGNVNSGGHRPSDVQGGQHALLRPESEGLRVRVDRLGGDVVRVLHPRGEALLGPNPVPGLNAGANVDATVSFVGTMVAH